MLRSRLESMFAALCALLAVVTALWPEWIEALTGLDPDAGNGMAEWLLVVVFGIIAVGVGVRARADHRTARAQPAELAPDLRISS